MTPPGERRLSKRDDGPGPDHKSNTHVPSPRRPEAEGLSSVTMMKRGYGPEITRGLLSGMRVTPDPPQRARRI